MNLLLLIIILLIVGFVITIMFMFFIEAFNDIFEENTDYITRNTFGGYDPGCYYE